MGGGAVDVYGGKKTTLVDRLVNKDRKTKGTSTSTLIAPYPDGVVDAEELSVSESLLSSHLSVGTEGNSPPRQAILPHPSDINQFRTHKTALRKSAMAHYQNVLLKGKTTSDKANSNSSTQQSGGMDDRLGSSVLGNREVSILSTPGSFAR